MIPNWQTRFRKLAEAVARGLNRLGNSEEGEPFGAIESHGIAITEAAETIKAGLESVADAIKELAGAIGGSASDGE